MEYHCQMTPHVIEAASEMLFNVTCCCFKVGGSVKVLDNHRRARAHAVNLRNKGRSNCSHVRQQLPLSARADMCKVPAPNERWRSGRLCNYGQHRPLGE